MPGLQGDTVMAALGSPIKKSKLSLKFFQKKETKRALDFSETQVEEQAANPVGCEEPASSCDQSVPALCSPSPSGCEKKEDLVPFVGFNNLGNTCYLNSILQVLYYCPGFKDVIKKLYKLSKSREKQTERSVRDEEEGADLDEQDPAHMELLGSFYNLITSVELLQSSFLRNPDKYSEGDLATPPRRVLHTLRQLNPMYEGYLQHDAQEVLQCILGYIQEACETIGKEQNSEAAGQRAQGDADKSLTEDDDGGDGPLSGKRKSDTEAGNAKKRPKSQSRTKKRVEEQQHFTRSKRKSCGDITVEPSSPTEQPTDKVEKEKEQVSDTEGKDCTEEVGKTKKRARLSWLKPSGKQPSIFSKFCSMGRLSSHTGSKTEGRQDHEKVNGEHQEIKEKSEVGPDKKKPTVVENQSKVLSEDLGLDMLKHLFQGQLVLRTRCLECECYTERREDFQDISVPVQEDEAEKPETSYEISPEPKSELKTLNWAISQFASVERIVGEDKYFCETCQHYTEAERSLLFDKMPEVITIHLKCFAANSTELDPYAGLSKVNTPLRTPLKLSLDEWSTGPVAGGHQYELFAVVMHSGVTISSGHYTTYIRMMGLHNTQLREEEEVEAGQKAKSLKREELQDYDDGEVSFSVGGRGQNANTAAVSVTTSSKAAGKKLLEGVGLLGGQRSLTSYELGAGKQTTHDKTATVPPSCSSDSQLHNGGIKKDVGTAKDQGPNTNHQALQNLLDYEGKWMLFDDSEVRLYMEEDFLRACSPETSSTSTPYLLFYRKTQQQQK
ncbi:ubiquitin carboxyl-terminal hydrolase 1 isoform X3 [Denticeps clupeoides]|uniref:ubiquitin carboxyl-terminal hydrolase 1 isoform X3 n=1 Tax=Denticeps clupeoides TaxID=299321 RepID=UPI0010A3992D|nr:ubiquitin carboxyl-terminal hydrolase 1 isoform X3 [Denticeps clupeoides]